MGWWWLWPRLVLCAGTVLCGMEAKGTYFPAPGPVSVPVPAPVPAPGPYSNRFNLYTSGSEPQFSPGKPLGKHKTYCAYVVQRNITCALQEGAESYVKAEYPKCGWSPKCPGKVMYRTLFRPRYKIGYKTVTELAWRCCPGVAGQGCPGRHTDHLGHLPPHPSPKIPPGQKLFPIPRMPPPPRIHSDQLPGPMNHHYSRKLPGLFGERLDRLEEDMHRLSQSYSTLQGMVSGLGDHLRLAIREDTAPMIGAPMHSPRAPDSTVGFGVIPEGVVHAAGGPGDPPLPVGEILTKVTEVSDTLKTKTGLLDQVQGLVLDHDSQIKQLLESSRPSPLTSLALLEEYVDARLSRLRGELLDGFEKKLVHIQSTCDFQIREVRQQCEEEKASSLQLQQALDGKELEIKREISHLETQIQGLSMGESCCGHLNHITERMDILEKGLHALSESQKTLDARLDGELARHSPGTLVDLVDGRLEDLEARINASERGAGGCCPGPDEGVRASEVEDIRTIFEDKMRALEDRFLTIVGELSNASSSAAVDGAAVPLLEADPASGRRQSSPGLSVVQSRLTALETLCSARCAPVSGEAETITAEIKDFESKSQNLVLQVDRNFELLQKLNSTVLEIQRQLEEEGETSSLQGEITLLKVNLNTVSKSLTGLKDSVHQYSDAIFHVNSSLGERERKVDGEVQALQDKVSGQGAQLLYSNQRVLNLKGDLQRLKAQIAQDLGHCKHVAQDVQREVGRFDQRVAQVESLCGGLSLAAGGLDTVKEQLLGPTGALWGSVDQINTTLATHAREITTLRNDLLDFQAKVSELSEQMSHLPDTAEQESR
uniref:Elastin microfibril interfacer 3 n=1 Tax=Ornithorhynchus anatinus TaxID=9258 RepID=F6X916_ORNAN